MRRDPLRIYGIVGAAAALYGGTFALGAGADTQRINGDKANALLGPGTGVIVGIVDSGIKSTHAALSGTVTGGAPRLAAQGNFSGDTSGNVNPHGTEVASQILSRDPSHTAAATDARYIDARAFNAAGSAGDAQVVNAVGFAVGNHANILNFSFGGPSDGAGNSQLALMSDYISGSLLIPVVIASGNTGTSPTLSPSDGYNVFSVGATSFSSNWSQIASFSSHGPNANGRNGPNISAPGDNVAVANPSGGFTTNSGTSFAAPNVVGIVTDEIGYGKAHGYSVDPVVLRATTLNSAEKVKNVSGGAWAPAASSTVSGVFTVTSPLDNSSGAGQINGLALYKQYAPGDFAPGIDPGIGWDLNSVAQSGVKSYHLGQLLGGTSLTTTLDWSRHVAWTDTNSNGVIDSTDTFAQSLALSNLDLMVFRNGSLVAESISTVDSIEQLNLSNIAAGDYTISVEGTSVSGSSESYGLAWSSTVLPEPASITTLFVISATAMLLRRRRRVSDFN